MKREWEIGRCIHNIYEPDKALPGYMGTGEGVVTESGEFIGMALIPLRAFTSELFAAACSCEPESCQALWQQGEWKLSCRCAVMLRTAAGMILERLEGRGPNRHIMTSDFNDIHYMEEFLFCLFNALDIGQKAIGFHHSGESGSSKSCISLQIEREDWCTCWPLRCYLMAQ